MLSTLLRESKFATTWQAAGSFQKASSFDSQINFKCFTNLGNTGKSDQSAINRVSETSSEETQKNDAWSRYVSTTQIVS